MDVNAWNYMGGSYAIHKQTPKFYFIKPEGKIIKTFFCWMGGGGEVRVCMKKLNPVI
jgi:hypothetical protein